MEWLPLSQDEPRRQEGFGVGGVEAPLRRRGHCVHQTLVGLHVVACERGGVGHGGSFLGLGRFPDPVLRLRAA